MDAYIYICIYIYIYIYIYNTYTYIYIYNIMENIQRTSALQYIFLFLLFKTFDSCIYVTEVKVFTGFKLQSLLHWTLERVRGQVLSASWSPHRSQRRRSNGDLRVESRTDFTKVTKRKNRGRNTFYRHLPSRIHLLMKMRRVNSLRDHISQKLSLVFIPSIR